MHPGFDPLQGGFAVVRNLHPIAELGELTAHRRPHARVVVDGENDFAAGRQRDYLGDARHGR